MQLLKHPNFESFITWNFVNLQAFSQEANKMGIVSI
jgi:hypothetical protein